MAPCLSGSFYELLQGTRPGDLLQRSSQGEALSTIRIQSYGTGSSVPLPAGFSLALE